MDKPYQMHLYRVLEPDIDSLGHASRIFGHCWDAQEFGTSCF